MADVAAPAVVPVDVAADLQSARGGGAQAYVDRADALAAAGHVIPYQHKQWVEQCRAAIGRPEQQPQIHVVPGKPQESRAYATADHLIRNSMDPARVTEAMAAEGHTEWQPDTRSVAQRAHDDAYGITPYVDAAQYSFVAQPDVMRETPGVATAITTDARNVAAELNLPPAMGSALITGIVNELSALNGLDAAGRLDRQTNTNATLTAAFGAAKVTEMSAAINALLDGLDKTGIKGAKFIDALRPGGALCDPNTFTRLARRAEHLKAWKAGRP